MKTRVALLVAALALFAQSAMAQVERKDLQVFNDISNTVNRYAFFTIFDGLSANVENGTVTLTGNVVVMRGQDVLRGQRLVVDLTNGVSRMDHGRVEGLFQARNPDKK